MAFENNEFYAEKLAGDVCHIIIKRNVNKNRFLVEKKDPEAEEIINNSVLSQLQDVDYSMIETGEYFTQINPDNTVIAVHISTHGISFHASSIENNNKFSRDIYYDLYLNTITFKYVRNDEIDSSHEPKIYYNYPVEVKIKNNEIDGTELDEQVEKLLSDVDNFIYIKRVVPNIDEIKKSIWTYLHTMQRK